MFIEFSLPCPEGHDSWQAADTLWEIKRQLDAWSTRLGIDYSQKTIKYKHRVCFNNDSLYTLFLLTFPRDLDWRLITDLNNRS